jgi:hypothetical protein
MNNFAVQSDIPAACKLSWVNILQGHTFVLAQRTFLRQPRSPTEQMRPSNPPRVVIGSTSGMKSRCIQAVTVSVGQGFVVPYPHRRCGTSLTVVLTKRPDVVNYTSTCQ